MALETQPSVVVRGICERDIDLLLLEELVASADFRVWFLGKLGIRSDATLQQAERSVSAVSGESDLELTFRAGRETVRVLVENKVDAPLQPDQAGRYHERALAYQKDGVCDRVVTAVIAPEVYFDAGAKHGFDAFVNYEAVLSWFETAVGLGPRRTYKVAAMRQAIERGRQGWQMVPDVAATSFWRSYWELAEQVAPTLRMPKPAAKPATSSFIRFCPLSLPSDVTLYHKVPYGRVDLQFAGMGNKLTSIQKRFGRFLSPEMRVDRAAKSAAIRIGLDEIDMTAPFANSKRKVEQALAAALALLRMYEATRVT
jgi:hypothetical protein